MFGSLIAIGICILLLVITAAFFSREVTKRVLVQVSKNLKTEIKVGDADLSLLRYFPDATVTFKNVRAKDLFGGRLLDAGEVSFRFGLVSLFGSTTEVRSVVLKDGTLRIVYDKNGRPNFDIFKEKSSKPSADNASIDLSLAEWENLTVDYSTNRRGKKRGFLIKKSRAGNFSAKRFNLDTRADFYFRIYRFRWRPFFGQPANGLGCDRRCRSEKKMRGFYKKPIYRWAITSSRSTARSSASPI